MSKYDPNEDYCGPFGKAISKCISRCLCGIDTNYDCYRHDEDYANQVGKEKADKAYMHNMHDTICQATSPWSPRRYIALTKALRRYHIVKWFGQGAYDDARSND